MTPDEDSLTHREMEVLRLLADGHDAKSAADHLGLSVHTINERLRAARRKLGVSSSRAAARRLAQAERDGPKKIGDKNLGADTARRGSEEKGRTPWRSLSVAGGLIGVLLMSAVVLIVARGLPSSGLDAQSANPSSRPETPRAGPPGVVRHAPAEPGPYRNGAPSAPLRPIPAPQAAIANAEIWLALLDRDDWDGAWREASGMLRAGTSEADWISQARARRETPGVRQRRRQYALYASSLEGEAPGASVVIQYRSTAPDGEERMETVMLVREQGIWRISAYMPGGPPPAGPPPPRRSP